MNLENMNLEFLAIIMASMLLYLFYFIFTKDAHYTRSMRSVASVVEELNREVFHLKKQLAEIQKNHKVPEMPKRMSDDEIYQEIERSVYDTLKPISHGLRKLEDNIRYLDESMNSRILSLESGVKNISIPSSMQGNGDEKIITLYKQGVEIDTISRELHIAKAEVEFVLKINRIK